MGVLDGQPVSAAVTNPAFLDANADDTALGKLTLNNISDPLVSGPQVSNIQKQFNALFSFTGKPEATTFDYLPPWTNNQIGTSTDSIFIRTNTISGAFDGTIGHDHSGVNGQGPLLSGSSITNFPLMGFFLQGVQLTAVTGSSTDVSTELSGKTPSSGSASLGVVVTAPFNRVILRDTNGDEFTNGLGDVVYGRLTESLGVWTLSYYYLSGGTETSYSFVSAEDIDWYYQELFAPNISTPVYSPLAVVPSDNTTADVVDATETQAGKMLFANAAPPSIASASSKGGTIIRAAYADHTHQGVRALLIDGDPTEGLGDVTLLAGAGISLSWSSGKIEITNTSTPPTQEVEYRTLTSGEATAKQLILSFTPLFASQVILDVIGGGPQVYGSDYTVTGNVLTWTGLGLDPLLVAGDTLRIIYQH